MSSPLQHIVNNFSLYGFGDPRSGFLQSIKETLENSMDAIKDGGDNFLNVVGKVQLVISGHDLKVNCIVLDCEDNGCGMADPAKLLELFSTTKANGGGEHHRAGRFGMGLSASLLYSLIKTDESMRIVTKKIEDDRAIVADFVMDFDGQPKVLQEMEIQLPAFRTGTKVRLCLPLLPNSHQQAADIEEASETLRVVIQALDCFLTRMYMLPSFIYQVHLDVDLPSLQYHERFDGFPAGGTLDPATYRDRLLERVRECIRSDELCDFVSTWELADEESDFECTASVVLVLKDMSARAVS
jgi:hypothetical protein